MPGRSTSAQLTRSPGPLLKATLPDGSYMVRPGSGGFDCSQGRHAQSAETCTIVSVIPATFDQDQFSMNIDHQLTRSNKLSGKFFFTNQPSIDPLANGNALTRHERNEKQPSSARSR